MGYLKTSISEGDLKERCKEAIEKEWTIHKLFHVLRKEGYSIGYPRLRKMWIKHNGYINDNYGIFRRR